MIEEGEQRAKELNVMFIETSAKTGCNVKQVIPAVSPYFAAFWAAVALSISAIAASLQGVESPTGMNTVNKCRLVEECVR